MSQIMKQLLEKSNKSTIEIKKLQILPTEIFKTINNLNAPFVVATQKQRKCDFEVLRKLALKFLKSHFSYFVYKFLINSLFILKPMEETFIRSICPEYHRKIII